MSTEHEFADESCLSLWIARLGAAYAPYGASLWASGFRTKPELAHASIDTYQKAGLPVVLHIENIIGTAKGEIIYIAW